MKPAVGPWYLPPAQLWSPQFWEPPRPPAWPLLPRTSLPIPPARYHSFCVLPLPRMMTSSSCLLPEAQADLPASLPPLTSPLLTKPTPSPMLQVMWLWIQAELLPAMFSWKPRLTLPQNYLLSWMMKRELALWSFAYRQSLPCPPSEG